MPEADTVWWAARRLDAVMRDQVLTVSDLRMPALATVDLTGRTVTEVASYAKHLLMRLAATATRPSVTVHSHLRMEGAWRVYAVGRAWNGGPWHQIRAHLRVDATDIVGYRLGALDVVATSAESSLLGHLGPDILALPWENDIVTGRLMRDPARPIGEALLDQTVVAGLGTVWRAETLFVAGVGPWTPVGAVADLADVVNTARRLLWDATVTLASSGVKAGPRQTTDDRRGGARLWVYGRDRQPCRRCGTTIRTATQGPLGRERPTYWCPTCQPGVPGA